MRLVREVEFMKPEEYRNLQFQFETASVFFGIGDEESGYWYLKLLFDDGRTHCDKFIYAKYAEIDNNFDNHRKEERFQNLIRGAN